MVLLSSIEDWKWYRSQVVRRRSATPPFAKGGAIPTDFTMFYIYILQSKKDKGLYIGFSTDLKRRFEEHIQGGVDATKNRIPLELKYYEAYTDEQMARQRERNLKQFGSAYTGLVKRLGLK